MKNGLERRTRDHLLAADALPQNELPLHEALPENRRWIFRIIFSVSVGEDAIAPWFPPP
jgi:hypothetical protein